MKRFLSLSIIILMLLTSLTVVTAQDGGLIAFSQGTLENEWRVLNTEDMERAAVEAGYEFVWTDAQADPAKQLADIEDLLARQPDLLVVAPVEFEPLAPVPDMAAAANVPLIVIDRALPGEPGSGTWLALLTIDFVETGRLVAEDVVEELTARYGEPRGRILQITGTTGASPVIDQQAGIDEVLSQYPDIEIIGSCDGQYAREPGRQCMEDFLQTFEAGAVDGVIAYNDEMVLGALQAIDAAGREELVGWIWGKDGTRTGLEALLENRMTFTVQTPPYFGDLTIQVFEQYLAGEDIELVQYVAKEVFDNDLLAQRERVRERIAELEEMGVGCC